MDTATWYAHVASPHCSGRPHRLLNGAQCLPLFHTIGRLGYLVLLCPSTQFSTTLSVYSNQYDYLYQFTSVCVLLPDGSNLLNYELIMTH